MKCLKYQRPDGKTGVGFRIEFAGKKQHSIAWPDRVADRMLTTDLERYQIEVVEVNDSDTVETTGEELTQLKEELLATQTRLNDAMAAQNAAESRAKTAEAQASQAISNADHHQLQLSQLQAELDALKAATETEGDEPAETPEPTGTEPTGTEQAVTPDPAAPPAA